MATQKDFRVKNGAIIGTGITFDSATTADAGVLTWNNDEDTLDISLNTDVTLQVGQEQLFYGKATEAIANGDIVMFAGAQGDHLLMAKADMQSVGFQPEYVIGVATQALNTNDFGFVTSFGKVRGLDTDTLAEGTIIYLDPTTPGGWVTSAPSDGSHVIQLAAVTREHQNQGTILVRPLHKDHLDELQGVNITSLADGQVLVWDADSNQWINGDAAASFTQLTDTPSSFGTAGQAVIVNSGADGLEFGDVTADFAGLSDSPSSYTDQGGRLVKVNDAEDGVDFGDYVVGQTSREYFAGDGTTTEFTLTNTYAGDNGFFLFVDGVIQKPGSGEDYTVVNGTTLTFNVAPQNNAEIFVYGITPLAQNVPVDGSVTAAKLAVSAYTRDTFSGDSSTTAFTLTRDPGSVYSPLVFVDGVIQDPITHYTVSGTTLTFTFTPATGTDNILVVYGPTLTAGTVSDGAITFAKLAPGNFAFQVETGDNSTTDFALDQYVLNPGHVIVTVAGVPQSPDGTTYTITNNGNTISFSTAPALDAKIVIRYYASATYSVPSDDSVTNAKMADNAIDTAEIVDAAVTPAKLDREYATKGTSIALSIALG